MGLKLAWAKNILTIQGAEIPGKALPILYLEAYCRPGSTDRDWNETVIGHRTQLISRSDDGKQLKLRCELNDGVRVEHTITAGADEVVFQLTAHNPTDKPSQAHWAQACIRVGDFTGFGNDAEPYAYLAKSFIFLDGTLQRLPTAGWAVKARYTPGQVWCPVHVPRDDVNPRPLSSRVPSNGLIGCFSSDEKLVLATAWEPYQELFQGVIRCLHSDFRIGGLAPGETKKIRGKIYLVPNDIPALLKRYAQDFPEHKARP
ncbi:MAG: hypothetical protein ABSE73_23920 [Planctomycetota bacterium]